LIYLSSSIGCFVRNLELKEKINPYSSLGFTFDWKYSRTPKDVSITESLLSYLSQSTIKTFSLKIEWINPIEIDINKTKTEEVDLLAFNSILSDDLNCPTNSLRGLLF